MSTAASAVQTTTEIVLDRFNAIVRAVRDARTNESAFMHAARLAECMDSIEDLLSDNDVIARTERTFEDVLRTTPFLKNKLGLLCPRLVQPIRGITIYRVITTDDACMPASHNKIRGSRAHLYLSSANDLRSVFSNATDDDFAPGLLDFLDTLNHKTGERQTVLLELNGNDGTFLFGDLPDYNIFVRDPLLYPWMNYVNATSIRNKNMTCAAAILRDQMVESLLFSHVRPPMGGAAIFSPVGSRPGHWNTYIAECPGAPRRVRRRVGDHE